MQVTLGYRNPHLVATAKKPATVSGRFTQVQLLSKSKTTIKRNGMVLTVLFLLSVYEIFIVGGLTMKQLETTKKVIGENTFYIRPFPAFVAAGISGELGSALGPIVGGLAPLVGGSKGNFMEMDIEKALPSVTSAFSTLSGDKVETLLSKLLTRYDNISVQGPATDGQVMRLTEDLANEVFCGEVQDMYILSFEVIKLNFKGFFEKLGSQFGSLQGLMEKVTPSANDTES